MHAYTSALKNVCIYRYLVTVVTTMLGYLCSPGQCKSPSPGPPELSITPSANDYLRGQVIIGVYIHLGPVFITGNHGVDTGTSCSIGFIGIIGISGIIGIIGISGISGIIGIIGFILAVSTGFMAYTGFICYIGIYCLYGFIGLYWLTLAYTGFICYIGLY